jgi:hypothetical protein
MQIRSRKRIYVWPAVVAQPQQCFRVVCTARKCLVDLVPESILHVYARCPICRLARVQAVSVGVRYFGVLLQSCEGVGSHASHFMGPYEDPADSIIRLSTSLGMTAPKGLA